MSVKLLTHNLKKHNIMKYVTAVSVEHHTGTVASKHNKCLFFQIHQNFHCELLIMYCLFSTESIFICFISGQIST